MATDAAPRLWQIGLTLIFALALTVVPLPQSLAIARPDWVALVVIYWAIFAPLRLSLWLIALAGLALDTLYGTLLGLHSLALITMAYVALKLHLRLRVFSWVQLAAAVAGMIVLYEFALFWSNGVAGMSTEWIDYWLPVLTSILGWPFVLYGLDMINTRFKT